MAFKHYDVVRAVSPSDLAKRLTQKLKEGWQPFGSPVAITPYTLMQAIAAEGDVVVKTVRSIYNDFFSCRTSNLEENGVGKVHGRVTSSHGAP